MKKATAWGVIFLLIFISSCKKNKDTSVAPLIISLSTPGTGATYLMYDTVIVTGRITDGIVPNALTVGLYDIQGALVQSNMPIVINGTNFNFTAKYFLSDLHLASGQYNIRVTATDQYLSAWSESLVNIVAAPTIKTGYYICGASQTNIVTQYDVNFNSVSVIPLNTGFNGMAFGSYYQQLYLNGNHNQSVESVSPQTSGILWSFPYIGGGLPEFTFIGTDNMYPYIGYYTGNVVSYNSSGGIQTTYINHNNALYPRYFTVTSTYGAGIFSNHFAGPDELITYGKLTGVPVNSLIPPCTVSYIFEHTADELYLFGNDAQGNATLYLYSVTGNVLNSSAFSLGSGKLFAAAQVDSDHFILSIGGSIYLYQYSTANLTLLLNMPAQKLLYNPARSELDLSSKNTFNAYSLTGLNTLVLTNSKVFTDSILDFEVITNK